MSFLVPPEISKDINWTSGYIKPSSKFYGKTDEWLFLSNENVNYLKRVLVKLLTDREYVSKYIDMAQLPGLLSKDKQSIYDMVNKLVVTWKLPNRSDKYIINPVQQLDIINREFLLSTSKAIMYSPDCIINDIYQTDDVTGIYGHKDGEFGASSYYGGTWHPETIFTDTSRNRKNPYWTPLNINIITPPDGTYNPNNGMYEGNGKKVYGLPPGPGFKYKYNVYGNGSLIPRWRTWSLNRPYERNIDESLMDGGRGDRRVNHQRGYDMSSLWSKSY